MFFITRASRNMQPLQRLLHSLFIYLLNSEFIFIIVFSKIIKPILSTVIQKATNKREHT